MEPAQLRGRLSAEEAERRGYPKLAGEVVTFQRHSEAPETAMSIWYGNLYLGGYAHIGQGGIVLEEENDDKAD